MVDFSGFNNAGDPMAPPSAPLENQYGPSTPASVPGNAADMTSGAVICEPTPGGSAALESQAGGEPFFYSGC